MMRGDFQSFICKYLVFIGIYKFTCICESSVVNDSGQTIGVIDVICVFGNCRSIRFALLISDWDVIRKRVGARFGKCFAVRAGTGVGIGTVDDYSLLSLSILVVVYRPTYLCLLRGFGFPNS